ncbi:MAG: hypothetical protein HY675_10985 [Chloroflexi bacterium]|nr:hypothetical protein [Chloroflexota bacterium]
MIDTLPRLIILGAASAYVSQAVELAEDCGYQVAAVVDNLGVPLCIDRSDIPVHTLRALPDHLRQLPAICCLGTPNYRRRVVTEAVAVGVTRFVTLVHPTAYVYRSVQVGVGSMVSELTSIGSYCRLGDHVLVRDLASVGHNCSVGDYVTIGPGSAVAGPVQIESGAYIGVGARIIPEVTIGANSVIAAGAVVTGDVAPNTLVAGVPAKVKREGIPGYEG